MKTFRIAVIGCGAISGNHINAIIGSGNQICALCDIVPEHAQEKIEKFELGNVPVYTDYVELLEKEKPDSIHICTPHYLHAEMVIAALGRGINVLCEKPLATTMEQLHAVLEAEEKSSATLGVCQQNRYEPRMLWLMDYIKEHGVKSGLGIVSWKRDAKYYATGAWRGKIIEEGGGVMINQALHTLDLLQHLCGMPTHVTAHTDNDYHKDCIEVEDTATAHFELPDGMMCHFYGTTAATADLPVQLQFVTMDKVRVIAGNDFVLLNGKPVEIEDTRDHANLVGKTVWGTGHAILIRDFYTCLAEGRPFRVSGKEAAKVVCLILSMYQSQGERIEILS